jgi:acyl-CoA synthetase (NDP forming)/RimJ/RimL family protein N-acetyltransferase
VNRARADQAGASQAGDYPANWEADVVLSDGGTAHVRPILPGDADRLERFYARLSPETIYFRFFAPYPKLSARDVVRFTTVDHDERAALIVLVGEEMIGVVRYDRISPEEAEVAFNIEDAHQGRGVGSVLLEHIAAAARERGIKRFTAEVLPTNRRMINVFKDAGYDVAKAYEDGVVSLHFDIAQNETAREVMQSREHRAEARSIARLLNPASVAVIGASRRYASVGQAVLRNLLAAGFTGTLHAVNPDAATQEIAGVPVVGSVLDVPGVVDVAVIAVPVAALEQVVGECARKGVHGAVIVAGAGGDEPGEAGAAGRERQRRIVRTAHAYGMRLVGPGSLGMITTDPAVRLNASLSPAVLDRGPIGIFCQSGALGFALIDAAVARGLGASVFISAGNRADVSGNDLMQFWEEDPRTTVLLLYLESIGNPRKFSRIARRIARSKPVVVVKAGRSSQGDPLDPTVRVSSAPTEAVDAMFRQAGAIRVENIDQLFDVAQLLATQPLPTGDRVAIVGNSPALARIALDSVEAWGLTLAGDPVTLPAEAGADDFRAALAAVFADPGADSLVVAFVPPLFSPDDDVVAVLAQAAGQRTKTVVSTFPGMRGVPEELRDGTGSAAGGVVGSAVPTYATIQAGVRALTAATRYGQWRRRPPGVVPELPDLDRRAARRLVRARLAAHPQGVDLRADDVAALLRCYGVQPWQTIAVPNIDAAVAAAAELGWPVALKSTAPSLRHRTDLGGVRLNLATEADLRGAWAGIADALGPEGARHLVVQRMSPPGVAIVLTSTEDPLFGPVISFGIGGVATELLGDRAYRIPPLTDLDVAELIRSVRAAPLLFGHRDAEPVDVGALEDLVARVSRLADDLPEIADLELNPVVVGAGSLSVLHATVRLAPPLARADQGPRALGG